MPVRVLLVAAGLASLALALLGLLLPLLPTTPFLLLSAGCFSRASDRMHRWLLRMPMAGRVLEDYERTGGLSRRSKRVALLMLWSTSACSAVLLADSPVMLLVAVTVAVCVSGVVLRLPEANAVRVVV